MKNQNNAQIKPLKNHSVKPNTVGIQQERSGTRFTDNRVCQIHTTLTMLI